MPCPLWWLPRRRLRWCHTSLQYRLCPTSERRQFDSQPCSEQPALRGKALDSYASWILLIDEVSRRLICLVILSSHRASIDVYLCSVNLGFGASPSCMTEDK